MVVSVRHACIFAHLLSWGWRGNLPGCRELTRWPHSPQFWLRTYWLPPGTFQCFSYTGFVCFRTSWTPGQENELKLSFHNFTSMSWNLILCLGKWIVLNLYWKWNNNKNDVEHHVLGLISLTNIFLWITFPLQRWCSGGTWTQKGTRWN